MCGVENEQGASFLENISLSPPGVRGLQHHTVSWQPECMCSGSALRAFEPFRCAF